ncbi:MULTISPECIES: MerR family transcriptional regulator [Streptomyces]|uniref:MerR family transcriptional regulator n=1 Tax=Streptomyces ramulosus TaxID=47762 RepID=A0ABW1FTF4_9ACTN
MFTIGDFARHGRVSVRMLRHYDALGLLRPAHVDPVNGYRFYEAAQLARLNRVLALKDLGFTLQQVQEILDETVEPEQLRGMLRLRQAELEAAMAAAAAQLVRVETRLRSIESEGHMSPDEVVVKRTPPVRVAELGATADSFAPEAIGPVVGPLFDELCRRLDHAAVAPAGPPLAYYEAAPGSGEAVRVHAAIPVTAAPGGPHGLTVVDLPAIENAATIVHRGSMDAVLPTAQTLARWIDANGYRSTGYARELYLACDDDPAHWVTELQEPITRR